MSSRIAFDWRLDEIFFYLRILELEENFKVIIQNDDGEGYNDDSSY